MGVGSAAALTNQPSPSRGLGLLGACPWAVLPGLGGGVGWQRWRGPVQARTAHRWQQLAAESVQVLQARRPPISTRRAPPALDAQTLAMSCSRSRPTPTRVWRRRRPDAARVGRVARRLGVWSRGGAKATAWSI